MKSFLFLFALSLLSLSKEDGWGSVTSPSKDACNKALSADEKKYFEKCCYIKYREDGKDKDSERSGLLTKYKFEHINDMKNTFQFEYSDTFVIECKAHYIKFGLLSLALLFI